MSLLIFQDGLVLASLIFSSSFCLYGAWPLIAMCVYIYEEFRCKSL